MLKFFSCFIALFCALALPGAAIGIDGPAELFDADPDTALRHPGDGKGPGTIPVEFSLTEPMALRQVILRSRSGNRYWQISRIRLLGRIDENAPWEPLAEKPWYQRNENDAGNNAPELHRLALDLPPERPMRFFKLELTRPHPFLYMELTDIELYPSESAGKTQILSAVPDLFREGGKPLRFTGGSREKDRRSISFMPVGTGQLNALKLFATSPNKYFYTTKVKVFATVAGETGEQPVAELEWYRRADADPEAPNGPERHELTVPLPQRNYTRFRIELIRPHGWIHMVLDAVELMSDSMANGKVLPKWSAYYPDQKIEARLFLTLPESWNGRTLEAALRAVDSAGNSHPFGSRNFTAAKSAELVFSGTLPGTGAYRLLPELSENGAPAPLNSDGCALRIAPRNSRFFFPVGSCFADRFTAWYGFSAVHDWMYEQSPPPSPENPRDRYAARLESGLLESSCINHVPWQLPEDADCLKMLAADGAKGRHHTFLLPEFKLRDSFVERAKFWNGHPGFYQYVYNNEICLVSWLMGDNVDFHPNALAAFREFLKERYPTIDGLNQAYAAKHISFATVEPPRTYTGPGAAWGDWMEFRVRSMATYAQKSYQHLKQVFPDTVITPKPISANEDYFASSKGIDPWLWRGACDVYGFDLYPWHRDGFYSNPMSVDFQRTQLDVDLHCTESGLSHSWPFTVDRDEAVFNCTYWPMFLRGVKACYWFEWYAAWETGQRGYWLSLEDGVLTPLGVEAARMAKQVQTLAPILNTGKVRSAEIAILWPWHDIWQTPNIAVVNAARGAYKLVSQRHCLADMISYHNIEAGELGRYKVLILPWSRHLPPGVAAAIAEFARSGGTVIADMGAGEFDPSHRSVGALDELFGIVRRTATDQPENFKVGDREFALPKIRTAPSPFPGDAAVAAAPRAETVEPASGTEVRGRFPDGSPALLTRRFGKGRSIYFANAWFAANRNFFYTQSRPPFPSTRAAEMANFIPPQNLELFAALLAEAGIQPELELPKQHFSWMDDGRQYVIFSALESRYGDLYGLTNWGARPMHRLPVSIRTDRKYKSLLVIDTMRETRTALDFTQQEGKITFVLPHLAGTALVLAIAEESPLLVDAVFEPGKNAVSARLSNGMKEPFTGTLEVRLDGAAVPVSPAQDFSIAAGECRTLSLPVRRLPPETWIDPRGIARKWYVQVTYDGNARAFEPVKNAPEPITR